MLNLISQSDLLAESPNIFPIIFLLIWYSYSMCEWVWKQNILLGKFKGTAKSYYCFLCTPFLLCCHVNVTPCNPTNSHRKELWCPCVAVTCCINIFITAFHRRTGFFRISRVWDTSGFSSVLTNSKYILTHCDIVYR